MNTFSEGDRVHIHGRSDYLGTVTADRDSMFPSMCGVRWADGEFAFVNPIKLAHVDPVAIPGMTEHERQALGAAYERALDAVDPIGFITGTNVPNHHLIETASHNRTETGTDVTDWQARAEQSEATLKAAKRVARQHMNRADKAESERETKAEACRTMAHIIELQGQWAVEATGSQDLIGDDGDGDWDVVWDRVTELGDKARQAEAKIAAVEALFFEYRTSGVLSKAAIREALDADR